MAMAVALAVTTAACGGGGGDDRETASPSTTGEVTTTLAGETATTTGDGATDTTGAGTTSGPAGKQTATTAKPAPGGTGDGQQAAASPGAAQPTAPGTYRYDLEGSQEKQTLTVSPPENGEQRARLTTPNAGTTEQRLRYGDATGIELLRIVQTSPAGTFDFVPDRKTTFMPTPLKPGASWTWDLTTTDGRTKLHADIKAEREETVAIGGEQVQTVVVQVNATISGDITGTSTRTLWVSEAYRLPVKQHEVTEGKVGTFPFRFETRGTLQSTKPS